PATAAAIEAMASALPVVSAERIAKELRQILTHPERARGMNLMLDFGLAASILPELLPMKGLPQGPPSAPTGDLWDHVMGVLALLGPKPSCPWRVAAWLNDVGRPRVGGRAPARYTFYYHEHAGARMTKAICIRLKLSNEERARATWLVEKHQFLCEVRQ